MRKVHILWAEDNDAFYLRYLSTLTAYLSDKGVNAVIVRAENGNAVYRKLLSQSYDLLILDIIMEHWSGIETVEDLYGRYPGLPMLIVSNNTDSADFQRQLNALKAQGAIRGAYDAASPNEWCEAVWMALSVKAPVILHLSDIHFGSFHAFRDKLKIEELLVSVLENITLQGGVDLVVISGDLVSIGAEEEFNKAKVFLWMLADTLNLPLERFVIVPGNHDIYRNEEHGRRFVKYIEFLNAFYGKDPDSNIILRRYPKLYDNATGSLGWSSLRDKDEDLYHFTIFNQLRTIIIGMNSVISADEDKWEFGRVEPGQLLEVEKALNKLTEPQINYFRLAVFHHHLFVVPSFMSEGEPERVVRNQGLILRHLISNKVRLILHGHTHYSIGYKYLPYFLDKLHDAVTPIYVFGTGTLSGKELVISQSYFHLTVIRGAFDGEDKVSTATVTPYRLYEDSLRWEAMESISISFEE